MQKPSAKLFATALIVCTLGACYAAIAADDTILDLSRRADGGDAEAQRKLGEAYYNGTGGQRDLDKAVKWIFEAAKQRDAIAEYDLGYLYERGEYVQKDTSLALQWYGRAAVHEYREAQFALGRIYQAAGPNHNLNLAEKWYADAAKQGHKGAASSLQIVRIALAAETKAAQEAAAREASERLARNEIEREAREARRMEAAHSAALSGSARPISSPEAIEPSNPPLMANQGSGFEDANLAMSACQTQRCSAEASACKQGSMSACYRASACTCRCAVESAPNSPMASVWRTCVADNMANADNLKTAPGTMVVPSGIPTVPTTSPVNVGQPPPIVNCISGDPRVCAGKPKRPPDPPSPSKGNCKNGEPVCAGTAK